MKHAHDTAAWLAAAARTLAGDGPAPPIRVRTEATAQLVAAALGRYGLVVPAATGARTWSEATALVSSGRARTLVTTRDVPGALPGPDTEGGSVSPRCGRADVERALAILTDAWRPGIPLPAPVPVPGHRHRPLTGARALARCDAAGLGQDVAELFASPDADLPLPWRPYLTRFMTSWPQVRHRVDAVVAGASPTHPWLLACLAAGLAGLAGAPYVGRLMGGPAPGADYRHTAASIRLEAAKLDVPALAGSKVLLVTGICDTGWTEAVSAAILTATGARDVVVCATGYTPPTADDAAERTDGAAAATGTAGARDRGEAGDR